MQRATQQPDRATRRRLAVAAYGRQTHPDLQVPQMFAEPEDLQWRHTGGKRTQAARHGAAWSCTMQHWRGGGTTVQLHHSGVLLHVSIVKNRRSYGRQSAPASTASSNPDLEIDVGRPIDLPPPRLPAPPRPTPRFCAALQCVHDREIERRSMGTNHGSRSHGGIWRLHAAQAMVY